MCFFFCFFFFQAEDGIRDGRVTGVQTCALPISVMLPKTVNISVPQEVNQRTTSKVERQSFVEEEEPAYSKSRTTSTRKTDQSNLLFDPLFEIPTLSHQQGVKEINEHISLQNESL